MVAHTFHLSPRPPSQNDIAKLTASGVLPHESNVKSLEAAGKEAPPRRARLRFVMEAAIDFYRAALRRAATEGRAGDPAMALRVEAWGGDAEEAEQAIRCTLDTLESIDRNANLTILVDAWTAILEQPSLARHN